MFIQYFVVFCTQVSYFSWDNGSLLFLIAS
jgi:hypothetical protein